MRSYISVLAATAFVTSVASAQTGLLAHWKLDETTGTTAVDSSPNGNDGTLTTFGGVPWATGQVGGAIQFDGAGLVRVTVKKGLPAYGADGSPITVAMWVKAPPGDDDRFYSESNTQGNNTPIFGLGTGRKSNSTADKVQVFIRGDGGEVINWQGETVVFDDQWHHLAWVDNAGMATLYVDGKPDTRSFDYRFVGRGTNTSNYPPFTMDTVTLGGIYRASACCQYTGLVDDVRVYSFALTEADLQMVMKASGHPACRGSLGAFGIGCGVGPLDIHAGGSAALGQNMNIRVIKGEANAPLFLLFGGGIVPLDLGSLFGLTGCTSYVSLTGFVITGAGTLDASGTSALIPFAVPNDKSLECAQLAIQGMTFTPPLNLVFSRALLAQLGN